MAMGPVDSAVLTGVVVSTGRWAQGKHLDMKLFTGAAVFAIFLSVMNAQSPDLASKFALLVLVAAVFMYGIPVSQKLGLVNK